MPKLTTPASPTSLKPIYVSCKVSTGLFPSEFFVLVAASGVYVDAKKVQLLKGRPDGQAEVPGRVLAYLVNEEQDRALVELVGEPVVGGLRTWVRKEELSAA